MIRTYKLPPFIRRYGLQAAAVTFWLGAVLVLYYVLQAKNITLSQLADQLETEMAAHWYGPVIFFVVFLVRPFTLIPGIAFVALGGVIFGFGGGFVYSLLSLTASAIIPYQAGRLFAAEIEAEDTPDTSEAPGRFRRIMQRMAQFIRQNAFESILALRLAYAPYDIVSVVAGNIHVPFRVFLLATFVGNISVTFTFTAIGVSLEGGVFDERLQASDEGLLLSSIVVFVFSIAAARYLRRDVNRRTRKPQDASAGTRNYSSG